MAIRRTYGRGEAACNGSTGGRPAGRTARPAYRRPCAILSEYLERIGLAVPPAPDAEGLALLHRAHRLHLPFDALDAALGRPIAIDPPAVFDKLVRRRRGGYCFEHNALFLAMLAALGFTARPLLARVWLGATDVPPRTHTLALVTLADGAEWIADAGFGGAYAPPMPLIDGARVTGPDGATHILSRDPLHGWMLRRQGNPDMTDGRGADVIAPDGLPQYSFTLDPVWPADLALSNHFTASAPASRFVTQRIASIVLPTGFATLTDRRYKRATASETVAAEITSWKAYRLRLSLVFGIDLTEAEVAALGLFEM